MSEVIKEPIFEKLPDISQESSIDTFAQLDYAMPPRLMSSNDKGLTERVKRAAQELHTKVYLEKGFITGEDLDEDGLFVDEYSDRSVHILAHSSKRRTACRYIQATRREGIMSLPTAKHFSIDPEVIKKVASVRRLTDLKSKEVIEVSGLVSVQEDAEGESPRDELNATRLLYAQILRESLDAGHKLWLLNTHKELIRSLRILVGHEQVHELGEIKEYMGSPTVPVAINPQEVVRAVLEAEGRLGDMKREYLKETLEGVSDKHLSDDILQLLDKHGITYEKSSTLQRILRNRKAMAMTALTGYALARAVPVANVEGFEGSAAAFAAIDIATVPPYAWGLTEMVTGRSLGRRATAASVAAGSFAAPYVYFWAEGHNYPPYVNAVVGGIIGSAVAMEGRRMRKDSILGKQLENED